MPATIHRLPRGGREQQSTFQLTDEIRRWALSKGVQRLDERVEHFNDYCASSGKKYLDYAAAFRNACRQDWARLGPMSIQTAATCALCHGSLAGGFTNRREGKVCPSCEAKR